MWPDRRLIDLFGIEHPIIQAPMAGAHKGELAAAVSAAGGLGSLASAMMNGDGVRAQLGVIRQRTDKPFNVNFFTHEPPVADAGREAAWRKRLAPYYAELGLDADAKVTAASRAPFDAALCELMVEARPRVVSFHFGLPAALLMKRLKDARVLVIASATTVEEARWLEANGVDAVIAQGAEAGGHRGMFLADDIAQQPGTIALVPQVVDAIKLPVIAAGGIGDARGIAAAFMLGAAGVQMGTAFLFCPEATISTIHRAALKQGREDRTALTNIFTGRPARGFVNRAVRELGPIDAEAPAFPLAATALQPLRAAAEKQGEGDFSPLWSGQAARLAREMPAADLLQHLAAEAQALLSRPAGGSAGPG